MRICRFEEHEGGPVRIGVVEGGMVKDVSAVADELPALRWPVPAGDLLIARLDALRPRIEELARAAGPGLPIGQVRFKCPVANPSKFICGAGNFAPPEMIAQGYHPRKRGLMFKMPSAAAGAADGVTLRWPERTTAHEMEIATIIGRQGTEIAAADAFDYIAGYAIGLDMTLQGPEFPDFGKSFDTYGVIGPWLVTRDEIPYPAKLSFTLRVNGELRQQDSVGNLVLDIRGLVEFASSIMTLYPGDVIFSGTPPKSVGPVRPGDVMLAQLDGVGEMSVAVKAGAGRKLPD